MRAMLETVAERVASTQDPEAFRNTTSDPFVQVKLGVESMPAELFGAVRKTSMDVLTSSEHFINFGELVTELAHPVYTGTEGADATDMLAEWVDSGDRNGDQSRIHEAAERVTGIVEAYAEKELGLLKDMISIYLEIFNGGSLGHGVESIDPEITTAVYRVGVLRLNRRFVKSRLLDGRVRYDHDFKVSPERDIHEVAKASGDASLVSESPWGGDLQQRAAMFALGGIYVGDVPIDLESRLAQTRQRNSLVTA